MSDQLKLVLQLKSDTEEKARQELAKAEAYRNDLSHQIEQLENYVMDYQRQLAQTGQTTMQQRHILMAYIQQIQTAISSHLVKLNAATIGVERARQMWVQARQQKQGIEKVLDARTLVQKKNLEKTEQKALDEFSSIKR